MITLSEQNLSTTDQYLTNYWPIVNGTMIDQIGPAHMTQGSLTSFTEDRFSCHSWSFIDELRFYNKSLSQSEILDLMNQNEYSGNHFIYSELFILIKMNQIKMFVI
jgi:hypothetical protein